MSTIAPIHYLCVFGMREDWRLERRLRRAGINKQRLGTSLEQLAERDWRNNSQSSLPLHIYFRFLGSSPSSYSSIFATVRIPVTRSHCDQELYRNLFDMRRSTFQIGAASIESGKIAWMNDEILVLMNFDKSFLCYFKGTSLSGENWFEHVFVLLSHLAAQRPVTRLWRHSKSLPYWPLL